MSHHHWHEGLSVAIVSAALQGSELGLTWHLEIEQLGFLPVALFRFLSLAMIQRVATCTPTSTLALSRGL